MTGGADAVLEIARVVRSFHGLRPLRVTALSVAAGERVALSGLDGPAAEVLVNLITGAALPDEGEVRVFGRSTATVADGDEWLASLDRFGIVSPRAVLLESASIEQNLAMPFTLDIEPVPVETAVRVRALAAECGIASAAGGPDPVLTTRAGDAPAELRARLHLARAIALDPLLLLLEHPTAGLNEGSHDRLALDIVRVVEGRRLTALAITLDERFALRVAQRALKLHPATGELQSIRRGWFR